MSQRGKRQPNRSDDGAAPAKRRKVRTAAEEEEAAALAGWTPRPLNDLKISSIYNRSATEAPAELFRKDLISAMKLPDSEPLSPDEYWVITDQWKQEWERGVQVPVNPDSLPEPTVSINRCAPVVKSHHDFKLPKKYIRITKDEFLSSDDYYLSNTPAKAEKACSYDLDDCDVAWLQLLNGERAAMGLQPVTEDQLERVIEELEVRCWEKIQTIVKTEEGLGIEYDENVICDVCRSPDSEEGNEMVFCDMCNICVHQACYGITAIPAGSWLCRTCALGLRPECVLCPNKGGAMKCTRSGQKWAHVSCALWIPEVSIGCVEKMEPITKISSIPQSRWALICVLCRERVGACIQCSIKTCKTAYHVTCAFKHSLEMKAIIEDENADDGVKLRSYCQKHSLTSKKEKSGSASEDEDSKRKKRKDMTSEEKNQARAAKLQEIEAEFDKHVSIKDITSHMEVDAEGIQFIYNYWILKRKAAFNKPLLPPKSEDVDILSRQQEQADLEKMKMFVQLRQDLERVRNLCYMVSRREKLSRSFFRMREQTFHKQVAVLSDPTYNLKTKEMAAVLEANHAPSIYDRLYSHIPSSSTSISNRSSTSGGSHSSEGSSACADFDVLLARIAGNTSPPPPERPPDVNGLLVKKTTPSQSSENPYKRLYFFNGAQRRRAGSGPYGASSGSETEPKVSASRRASGASSTEDDDRQRHRKVPAERKNTSNRTRKGLSIRERPKVKGRPTSKASAVTSRTGTTRDTSSDEERQPVQPNERTRARQRRQEPNTPKSATPSASGSGSGGSASGSGSGSRSPSAGSGSSSDELLPVPAHSRARAPDIYSDTDSDGGRQQAHPLRTKAAVKEFSSHAKSSRPTLENGTERSKTATPSVNKKVNREIASGTSSEGTISKGKEPSKSGAPVKKEFDPTELIVPQRQAAKKATESIRCSQGRPKEQTNTEQQDLVKTSPPVSEEPKIKPKTKHKGKEMREAKLGKEGKTGDIYDFEKDVVEGQEILAYVPQRQAAKKAAAHIKSGMTKPSAEPEADASKVKKEVSDSNKVKKEQEITKPKKDENDKQKIVKNAESKLSESKPVETKHLEKNRNVSKSKDAVSSSTSSSSSSDSSCSSESEEDTDTKPKAPSRIVKKERNTKSNEKRSSLDSVPSVQKQVESGVKKSAPISDKKNARESLEDRPFLNKEDQSSDSVSGSGSGSSSSESADSESEVETEKAKETKSNVKTSIKGEQTQVHSSGRNNADSELTIGSRKFKKAPDKKLKTSDGRPELVFQPPNTETERSRAKVSEVTTGTPTSTTVTTTTTTASITKTTTTAAITTTTPTSTTTAAVTATTTTTTTTTVPTTKSISSSNQKFENNNRLRDTDVRAGSSPGVSAGVDTPIKSSVETASSNEGPGSKGTARASESTPVSATVQQHSPKKEQLSTASEARKRKPGDRAEDTELYSQVINLSSSLEARSDDTLHKKTCDTSTKPPLKQISEAEEKPLNTEASEEAKKNSKKISSNVKSTDEQPGKKIERESLASKLEREIAQRKAEREPIGRKTSKSSLDKLLEKRDKFEKLFGSKVDEESEKDKGRSINKELSKELSVKNKSPQKSQEKHLPVKEEKLETIVSKEKTPVRESLSVAKEKLSVSRDAKKQSPREMSPRNVNKNKEISGTESAKKASASDVVEGKDIINKSSKVNSVIPDNIDKKQKNGENDSVIKKAEKDLFTKNGDKEIFPENDKCNLLETGVTEIGITNVPEAADEEKGKKKVKPIPRSRKKEISSSSDPDSNLETKKNGPKLEPLDTASSCEIVPDVNITGVQCLPEVKEDKEISVTVESVSEIIQDKPKNESNIIHKEDAISNVQSEKLSKEEEMEEKVICDKNQNSDHVIRNASGFDSVTTVQAPPERTCSSDTVQDDQETSVASVPPVETRRISTRTPSLNSSLSQHHQRSIFSPQQPSKDPGVAELFDFENDILAVDETADDGFGIPRDPDEMMRAPLSFSFSNEFLFKEDSKEDSARETLNLVEKLRMDYAKKSTAGQPETGSVTESTPAQVSRDTASPRPLAPPPPPQPPPPLTPVPPPAPSTPPMQQPQQQQQPPTTLPPPPAQPVPSLLPPSQPPLPPPQSAAPVQLQKLSPLPPPPSPSPAAAAAPPPPLPVTAPPPPSVLPQPPSLPPPPPPLTPTPHSDDSLISVEHTHGVSVQEMDPITQGLPQPQPLLSSLPPPQSLPHPQPPQSTSELQPNDLLLHPPTENPDPSRTQPRPTYPDSYGYECPEGETSLPSCEGAGHGGRGGPGPGQADERWVPPSGAGSVYEPAPYAELRARSKWSDSEMIPNRRSSTSSLTSSTCSSQREDPASASCDIPGGAGRHDELSALNSDPTGSAYGPYPPCALTDVPPFRYSEAAPYVGPTSVALYPTAATVPCAFSSPGHGTGPGHGAAVFPPPPPHSHYPPAAYSTHPLLQTVAGPKPPDDIPPMAPCGAAFTSSSHNMALTAAMVSPPPHTSSYNVTSPAVMPEAPLTPAATFASPVVPPAVATTVPPSSQQQQQQPPQLHAPPTPAPTPTPTPTPVSTPTPVPAAVPEAKPAPAGKRSPAKPTRTSARFISQQQQQQQQQQQLLQQQQQVQKSPAGKSPRESGSSSGTGRPGRGRGDGGGRRGRGGSRGRAGSFIRGGRGSRGRARSHHYQDSSIAASCNTIHHKLAGTVFDLEFDDESGPTEGVENLRDMRERRRSSDHAPSSCATSSGASHHERTTPALTPAPAAPPLPPPDRNVVAPLLPGPVDMRTYSSSYEDRSTFRDNLLGAFASEPTTAVPHVAADFDEEVENASFHSALSASRTPAPTPRPSAGTVGTTESGSTGDTPVVGGSDIARPSALSDSRNQLKVKIKGPFLDANYATSTPLSRPAPVLDSSASLTAGLAGQSTGSVAPGSQTSSAGTSSLRRMRKKELLRQYWTQERNLDEPGGGGPEPGPEPGPPANPPQRAVISIPKAVASMTSIPTREDYKAVVDAAANMERKRRGGKGTGTPLEGPYDDISIGPGADRRGIALSAPAIRRRGRPPKAPPPALAAIAPVQPPTLRIKIGSAGNAGVVSAATAAGSDGEEKRLRIRPPKKRLAPTNSAAPSVEELKRESMKFRRRIMQDFDQEEKKEGKRRRQQPLAVHEVHLVPQEDEVAPKIVIRIKNQRTTDVTPVLPQLESRNPGDVPQSVPVDLTETPADASVPSAEGELTKTVERTVQPPSAAPATAPDPPAPPDVRTSKVSPIRLKIARCQEGYVMKSAPVTLTENSEGGTGCEVR